MTKRILNSLTIGKIAAVDVPCQEGAEALILKRGTAPDAAPNAESFEGQLNVQNLWDEYGKAQRFSNPSNPSSRTNASPIKAR